MSNLISLLTTLGLILIIFSCKGKDNSSSPPNSVGIGKAESQTQFTIVGNHLYVIGNKKIKSFDISVPAETKEVSAQIVDFGIESLHSSYPYLFIGGQQGIYIYDASTDPVTPTFISQFSHARACDPVIVENEYAFITLRGTGICPDSTNELKVVNIANIRQPNLVKSYPLTAPIGLAANDDRLYICDGDSLKLFDSSNVENIRLKSTVERKECIDLIYDNSAIIVNSGQGITQYDISNDEFELLSHLAF